MLKPGSRAPEFTLPDSSGTPVSLSDYRGRKVVLYFYPRDNTPGCTAQACSYRDRYPAFERKGVPVIGISKDTWRTHANFARKHDLPFVLLADPEREVLAAYDVLRQKTMYGKPVQATVRTTYLIDENGRIEKAYENVSPEADSEVLLGDLETA